MEVKEKEKNRHKGQFVGGFFAREHLDKIEAVASLYDEHFGEPGRNRSRALRWIVECLTPEMLANFPKSQAPAGVNAQNEMAR